MSASSAHSPFARFDSLRAGGRSLELRDPVRVIEASRLEEVLPALTEVEAAVRAGGHAAGFLAYEAAPALDSALTTLPPRPGLPLVWFGIFRERAQVEPPRSSPADPGHLLGAWESSVGPGEYARQVAAIREWIARGDSYQVNHTFRLRARLRGSERALYDHLCLSQRGGYCALLRLPAATIASASPELFFRWEAGELEMRPMKGTRPRGRWTAEDDARAAELLASEKERAENLMIVDLLRNDAGRIAEYGTVTVDPLFEVESYPTVHQLTSTIRARTREGTTLTSILGALFPSGSVTGAPKVRTMQIIAGLESSPRGVYTGAIGFVSPGEAVFNVPIRTLLIDRATGSVELGVGSGVTYDSEAESEYRECLQKAAFTHHPARDFELLETMLHREGEGVLLLDEHLARLEGSARYFGYPYDAGAVRDRLARAVEGAPGSLRLRLRLARSGEVSLESRACEHGGGPLRVAIAAEPVDSGDPLLYHKTTWREPYERALAATPGYDDVILRNERGELTELTIGNLVVRRDGENWTPPLHSGVLPGTLRAVLLRDGALRERVLRPADLAGAEAVYRINSVQQWCQVTVDG